MGDCLEVKREYYQNCPVLDCVTQYLQSAAHSYEQFLQVQQWVCHIGTFTPCIEVVAQSCIIVRLWSGSGGITSLISMTNWFNRPRNDLYCVQWDIKQPTSQPVICPNLLRFEELEQDFNCCQQSLTVELVHQHYFS